MVNLLDLPQDVLLKVLCYLDVDDILRVERTCKYMRETTAMHQLWLTKLNNLEPTSVPDLPRYRYPNIMPYGQLRAVVIQAERAYQELTRCPSPVIAYKLIRSVIPSRPNVPAEDPQCRIHTVKVAPGGRYLLVYFIGCLFQELRLLDLDNEDNCVWSFNTQAEHRKLKSDPTINYFETEVFFDFDVQQDGSIAVVFGMDTFISHTPGTESEQRSFLKIVQLIANDALGSALAETQLVSLAEPSLHERAKEWAQSICAISGRFAVWLTVDDLLFIVHWESNRAVRFQFSILDHIEIWQDHLICRQSSKRFCAVSLTEAIALGTSSSVVTIDPNALEFSFIKLDYFNGYGTSNSQFSVSDLFFGAEPRCAMLSLIVRMCQPQRVHFTAMRAIFDPSQPITSRWSLMSKTLSVPDPSKDGFPWSRIRMATDPSRHGRLLVTAGAVGYEGKIQYGLIAIDKQGNLVFAGLANTTNTIPNYEFFHNNNVRPLRRDMLLDYIEPCSGMLVALTNRESGSEKIELYYPEAFLVGCMSLK